MREGFATPAPRATLRLAAATPERRRVAHALLAEAARGAGGHVEEAAGEVCLVGAEAGRAGRLRDLLDRLLGGAVLTPWPAPPLAPATPAPPANLAALDPWLDALDPLLVARRRRGWRLDAQGGAVPGFLRLDVARDVLAGLLGTYGADADLLDHAQRRMEARLLAALAEARLRQALLGAGPVRRLHLKLPAESGAALPQGLVVTVPLAAAADPVTLAARRAALAAAGCSLEMEGLDAEALTLVEPAALPMDLLRLAWSPALAADGPRRALAGVDPARLVLAGADGTEARDWARRQGIVQIESETPP
ncbi:hypothetical protein [Falsiroseomonas sp. CW058]|uniref:hypothetical protein n=1 Tax=Falsiroseomonas sp. CW058 TaxID=3388664 RepID=UPI003D3176DB